MLTRSSDGDRSKEGVTLPPNKSGALSPCVGIEVGAEEVGGPFSRGSSFRRLMLPPGAADPARDPKEPSEAVSPPPSEGVRCGCTQSRVSSSIVLGMVAPP